MIWSDVVRRFLWVDFKSQLIFCRRNVDIDEGGLRQTMSQYSNIKQTTLLVIFFTNEHDQTLHEHMYIKCVKNLYIENNTFKKYMTILALEVADEFLDDDIGLVRTSVYKSRDLSIIKYWQYYHFKEYLVFVYFY